MTVRQTQNILITGINGFVGGHLAEELAENGHKVSGVSREEKLNPRIKKHVSNYCVADLTDLKQIKTVEWAKIDTVIHLAGLAAVGKSFDNPELYLQVNTSILENLFLACQAQNCYPKIISISTGAVYGPTTGPVTEESPLKPSNPYSISKLKAEEIVNEYRKNGFKDAISVRPFNHIGPYQNGGFLVPDLGLQLVNNVQPIKAGNLSSSRDYTDVRDVARAYRLLAETPSLKHSVYNVCSGRAISGTEIFKLLKKSSNRPDAFVETSKTQLRKTDEDVIIGSSKRITEETGWRPQIDIKTSIQDFINSIK